MILHGTEPSPQQQAIEEDRQEEQLQQAIFDNNIDDNYNAMIAVDDVTLKGSTSSTYKTVSSRRLRKWPLCPRTVSARSSRAQGERAVKAVRWPEPSTKLYVVEMEREKIFGALKNLGRCTQEVRQAPGNGQRSRRSQDELLRMLPILVEAGLSSRSDLSLDRLNEALHAESSTVKSVFSPDSRLEGGWKAAYHDYVYSMMLFGFRKRRRDRVEAHRCAADADAMGALRSGKGRLPAASVAPARCSRGRVRG